MSVVSCQGNIHMQRFGGRVQILKKTKRDGGSNASGVVSLSISTSLKGRVVEVETPEWVNDRFSV